MFTVTAHRAVLIVQRTLSTCGHKEACQAGPCGVLTHVPFFDRHLLSLTHLFLALCPLALSPTHPPPTPPHPSPPLPTPFSQGLWRVIFRVQAVGRGRATGHLPVRPSAGGSGQAPVHRALPSFLHICTSLSQGAPPPTTALRLLIFF